MTLPRLRATTHNYQLLNVNDNAKTKKNIYFGSLTGILYLAPADLSGHEVCPMRTPGCTAACLNTAGHGVRQMVQDTRVRKTNWFFDDRDGFMEALENDIKLLVRRARRDNIQASVRLNGTSDIAWERMPVKGWPNLMERFPRVQFYDYTKIPKRAFATQPPNYHITYSLAEDNDKQALEVLKHGGQVAAVFFGPLLPLRMHFAGGKLVPSNPPFKDGEDFKVIDGDRHDIRFRDANATIVGLVAKGRARHDTSGFVRKAS